MLIRALQDCGIHIIWCVPTEFYSKGINLLPNRPTLFFSRSEFVDLLLHRNILPWSVAKPLAVIINVFLMKILSRTRWPSSVSDSSLCETISLCSCNYTHTKPYSISGTTTPLKCCNKKTWYVPTSSTPLQVSHFTAKGACTSNHSLKNSNNSLIKPNNVRILPRTM